MPQFSAISCKDIAISEQFPNLILKTFTQKGERESKFFRIRTEISQGVRHNSTEIITRVTSNTTNRSMPTYDTLTLHNTGVLLMVIS